MKFLKSNKMGRLTFVGAILIVAGTALGLAPNKAASATFGEGKKAGELRTLTLNNVEYAFRWCPPGTFTMGSSETDDVRGTGEKRHKVTLTQGFWLLETEVTREMWRSVGMPSLLTNREFTGDPDAYPETHLSWRACQSFIARLQRLAPKGWKFALPTEAQWEYACRAGSTGMYGGNGILDDMGWFAENNLDYNTAPIKMKDPNAWNLYDMHGNVAEWCSDWYGIYPSGNVTDPRGPTSGGKRVHRGGCWILDAKDCRSASRGAEDPECDYAPIGLRLALIKK